MSTIERLHQFLLPSECVLCGAPGASIPNLCRGCQQDLPANHPSCPRCAVPTPTVAVCANCLTHAPAFDKVLCGFRYEGPIRHLVSEAKFRRDLAVTATLGHLLAVAVQGSGSDRPQGVVPVPLHRRQLRRRGFNQALEVARPVASLLDLRLLPNACHRTRETESQSGLGSTTARKRNVNGAFAVRALPSGIRHIALVDDVVTTGATVGELARILKRQGVERVDVWAVARTPREDKK